MKILVYCSNYAPELTGIGKFTGEMCAWLARAGHQIRVITAPPYYPAWKVAEGYSAAAYKWEAIDGVQILRCPVWVPSRQSGSARILLQLSFALTSSPFILSTALGWRPDIVWTVMPSTLSMPWALVARWLAGAKSWLHVQDFEIDAAFELDLLSAPWLRTLALALEGWFLRRFDKVSSISRRMVQRLISKGVREEDTASFPNWADINLIFPLDRPSALRAELGIPDGCCVALYSGNLGEKQGVRLLVEVARHLSDDTNIRVVICGDGAGAQSIAKACTGVASVTLMPLQPLNRLNDLLNLADVHMLPQRIEAADLVMPSKLGGMLASGRPVVAGAAGGTQLAEEVSGCGIVVPPDDDIAMSNAIRVLVADKPLRIALGRSARTRAIERWSNDQIMRRFEAETSAMILAQRVHQEL